MSAYKQGIYFVLFLCFHRLDAPFPAYFSCVVFFLLFFPFFLLVLFCVFYFLLSVDVEFDQYLLIFYCFADHAPVCD